MMRSLGLLVVLTLGCMESETALPRLKQAPVEGPSTDSRDASTTATAPAELSAVAVSPDGKWLAIGLISDPSRVEVSRSGERQGTLELPLPRRTQALQIGDDGQLTVGLFAVSARTPHVAIVQAGADGRVLRQCSIDLDKDFVRRMSQWRGVQDLAANERVVFAVSLEGGVHRVDMSDCSLTTLHPAPAGDAERPGRLFIGDDTVWATVDGHPVGAWDWSGKSVASPPRPRCELSELPPMDPVSQRASSSDCGVSVLRTKGTLYWCEAGECTTFWTRSD